MVFVGERKDKIGACSDRAKENTFIVHFSPSLSFFVNELIFWFWRAGSPEANVLLTLNLSDFQALMWLMGYSAEQTRDQT